MPGVVDNFPGLELHRAFCCCRFAYRELERAASPGGFTSGDGSDSDRFGYNNSDHITDGYYASNGSKGSKGSNGHNGYNGYNGYNGSNGSNGYNGYNGYHGSNSFNGYNTNRNNDVNGYNTSERDSIIENTSVHSNGSGQHSSSCDQSLYSSEHDNDSARGFATGYQTDGTGSFPSNSVGSDSVDLLDVDGNGIASLTGGSSEWTPLLGPNLLGSSSEGLHGEELSEEQVIFRESWYVGGAGVKEGGLRELVSSPWRLNTNMLSMSALLYCCCRSWLFVDNGRA